MSVNTKYVALVRVSTGRQAASGLGEERQIRDIQDYVDYYGGTIIKTFIEHGSGGDKGISVNRQTTIEQILSRRPELQQALDLCELEGATLIFKEASRLTRFSLLGAFILNANIPLKEVDEPNESTSQIVDRIRWAEKERLKISQRSLNTARTIRENGTTKSGKPMGNPVLLKIGVHVKKEDLHKFDKDYVKKLKTTKLLCEPGLGPRIRARMAENNPNTIRALAAIKMLKETYPKWTSERVATFLNQNHFRNSSGNKFNANGVRALLNWERRKRLQKDYYELTKNPTIEGCDDFMSKYKANWYYRRVEMIKESLLQKKMIA
jgi:hypothetical protein